MDLTKKTTNIFFTTKSFDVKFGGLTTAMFRRAHVFTQHIDNDVNILTFVFKSNIEDIKEYLDTAGYTKPRVKYKNIYESLSNMDIKTYANITEILETVDTKFEYDELLIQKNTANQIIKEVFLLNNLHIRIKEYDKNSLLKRIRFYTKGNLSREYFYRENGSIYMVKKFDYAKKSAVTEIILLNKSNEIVKKLSNHKQLQLYWLKLLFDENKQNIIINDSRALDGLIVDINYKNVLKNFVIHSTHLREPYDTFSTVRLGNRFLFEHINKADGIVVLTEKQKCDLVKRYKNESVFSVIPHFVEANKTLVTEHKSTKRFIVISRFHEEKRLDHIIKAFNIVHKKGMEFQLDIYGDGNEKQLLTELINKYELQNKISLCGFTNDANSEFKKSIGSFLTSKYEGFGLTILESLNNACPVFAYDIKYGPSDMIEHGSNGFLIESGNIDELAKSIIHYLELPSVDRKAMFSNAQESILNFNEEIFLEKWKQTLKRALDNSNLRHNALSKGNFQGIVEEVKFNKRGLKIVITIDKNQLNNLNIFDHECGISIAIHNKKWDMLRTRKDSKEILTYELLICFHELEDAITVDKKKPIIYYINLSNESHRMQLKYQLKGTQRDNKQSGSKNVFYLVNNKENVEIGIEHPIGLRGYLRYIRHKKYIKI